MNVPDKSLFGEHLRQLREHAGLTQEELAERSGLSRDAISALERGRRRRPYGPTLLALADALKLTDVQRNEFRAKPRSGQSQPERNPIAVPIPRVPEVLTSIVGRSPELDHLAKLLTLGTARLISITGAGGVGKTRLSLELIRMAQSMFEGRVVFVPLGGIWDPALVLPTIADALGVRNPGGEALADQIALVLGNLRTLIVLDNLEHVADAAPAIGELIQTCPSLTVITTSRAPLRLTGEVTFPLQPLSIDGPESNAIELFVERARQTLPGFALTDRNQPVVAAICRALDGLPLAIELAAARIKVLPPEALLKRLETGIDLLSSGPRDREARLQSVRSAIAWSYNLLDKREQAAFRALSVFVGEFSLEAAESVLDIDSSPVEVIDILASLIDKSLIRSSHADDAEPRYSMMFTIQRFGIGELDASPESMRIHLAHAEVVLGNAERAANAFRQLAGAEQWPWFALLERERGNWRTALSWLHEHGETAAMLRLVTALAWFWYIRGPIREGAFWTERAIAMPENGAAPKLRPRALVAKGMLDLNSQNLHSAHAALAESLQTAPEPAEPWWIASAELFMGMVALAEGDYAFAEVSLDRSIATYRSIPHEINATIALGQMPAAAWGRGEPERALAIGREAIDRQRRFNDHWGLGISLGYQSLIAVELGDLDLALTSLRENLAIRSENVSVPISSSVAEHESARWQAGVWQDVATSLSILAVVMTHLDEHEQAARWFGAASGIHRLLGGSVERLPERAAFERAETKTQSTLPRARYSELRDEGSRLSGEDALAAAIATVDDQLSRRAAVPVS